MPAGFFEGIVHDRKRMQRAQTDLAFRWFAGYALHERLPEHSSLTRIRQRWGAERFRRIFEKTVESCLAAGLVNGQTVHVDASLIRADESWKSTRVQHVERVVEANREDEASASNDGEPPRRGRGRLEGRAANRHFTDRLVDEKLDFDYKLKPDVVAEGNALKLMRNLGLPI